MRNGLQKFLLALIGCLVAVIAYAGPGSPYLSYGWRPTAGGTTVAFDAKSGNNSNPSVASLSWTHTPVGTPTDVYVAVAVKASASAPTSVTYGGTSMGAAVVSQISTGTQTECLIYALANPAAGAQTVAVTLASSAGVAAFAVTVTGGNTTTATDGSIGGNNGGATNSTISDTVSTANGDLVIDAVTNNNNSSITGWTASGSQTALYTTTLTYATSIDILGGSYISATGATQAMGQTMGGGTDNIAHCVVSAKHG